MVALRKESVDRNKIRIAAIDGIIDVALRKESVDRNYKERPGQKARPKSLSARRAWIEICTAEADITLIRSLSARRAWIEIRLADMSTAWNRLSLSARRAWIEIRYSRYCRYWSCVALRKESVDRNPSALIDTTCDNVALRKESVDRNYLPCRA